MRFSLRSFRLKRKPKPPPIMDISGLATTQDLDKLRAEIRSSNLTNDQKYEMRIYQKWISMSQQEKKEKWNKMLLGEKVALERIVKTYKAEQEVSQRDGKDTRKATH